MLPFRLRESPAVELNAFHFSSTANKQEQTQECLLQN